MGCEPSSPPLGYPWVSLGAFTWLVFSQLKWISVAKFAKLFESAAKKCDLREHLSPSVAACNRNHTNRISQRWTNGDVTVLWMWLFHCLRSPVFFHCFKFTFRLFVWLIFVLLRNARLGLMRTGWTAPIRTAWIARHVHMYLVGYDTCYGYQRIVNNL